MKILAVIFGVLLSLFLSAKSLEYLPVPSNDLVRHTYYILSYNEKYEQANWVYYSITDSMIIHGGEERSNKFKIDPAVPTGSAKPSDYIKSGYDRGHLCPAGDMGFNPVAMQESFYMSNMSPQVPEFNRGIWKELETQVRNWAKKEQKLYVVSGPIFRNNRGTIGKDQVLVPGYYYKVIFDPEVKPRMISFILPNSGSDRPLSDFAVPVDEVEKQTGYDFFSQLPDDLESGLENKVELAGWFDGFKEKDQLPTGFAEKVKPADKKSDLNFYLLLAGAVMVVVLFVFVRSRMKK